jgi:hypothetical protein
VIRHLQDVLDARGVERVPADAEALVDAGEHGLGDSTPVADDLLELRDCLTLVRWKAA